MSDPNLAIISFLGLKKRRKKKVVIADESVSSMMSPTTATITDSTPIQTVAEDAPSPSVHSTTTPVSTSGINAAVDDEFTAMFGAKKKKKKTVKIFEVFIKRKRLNQNFNLT
jgi:hypothetical protein